MTNPLQELEDCGQSVWTDVISRDMIGSGALRRYVEEDGITGVTANPTIFEKAIVGSHDYDATIRDLASEGRSDSAIYEGLAVEDVGAAADILRPAHDRASGKDGFVSIEVSPEIAYDTQASIVEARRFWSELNRPNIMIKVPATPEGIPAIEQLTYEGVNVNITLIFAVEVYERVMDAYLKGLERRVAEGKPIDRIASVASFFVSRVDTLVDKILEEKAASADPETGKRLQGLEGQAANANAKIAYERFEKVFGSERFKSLERNGAQLQRPLWASTGTKNPNYPDTLYVDPLIGPHTVNTMTLETIEAFKDHGKVNCGAVREGVEEAKRVIAALEENGVSMKAVTDQLTAEGVDKFTASLHGLLKAIEERRGVLVEA